MSQAHTTPSAIAEQQARYLDEIATATTRDDLEAQRVALLGKAGAVTALLKSLGAMDADQRQAIAPAIHSLRAAVSDAIATRKAELEQAAIAEKLAQEVSDLSLPALRAPQGSIHPISQTLDQLVEIFADIGFAVATGPEIEDDWYNFSALNIGEAHPARAMHDSFYFPPQIARETTESPESKDTKQPDREPEAATQSLLLRTHTSPVQIRTMQSTDPPIYIIAPGRVYRADSDATHTPMFHQIEGLVIDRAIHMGHLRWTLETFLKAFFEREDIVLRLRPSYFPFTEPSVEVDVGYALDKGRRIVGGDGDAEGHGWMELLGGGMVHRRVIENCDLDPTQWQGFAFGVGVDRLAMLKYGMDDLRAFFEADIAWLQHYGFAAHDVPTLAGGISGSGLENSMASGSIGGSPKSATSKPSRGDS